MPVSPELAEGYPANVAWVEECARGERDPNVWDALTWAAYHEGAAVRWLWAAYFDGVDLTAPEGDPYWAKHDERCQRAREVMRRAAARLTDRRSA